jgi:hypothetical protein
VRVAKAKKGRIPVHHQRPYQFGWMPMQNDFQASKLRKARLVTADLLTHPHLIAPYFAMCKRDPIAVRLPWISFSAIQALESLLTHSMFVFEYDQGARRFSSRAAVSPF